MPCTSAYAHSEDNKRQLVIGLSGPQLSAMKQPRRGGLGSFWLRGDRAKLQHVARYLTSPYIQWNVGPDRWARVAQVTHRLSSASELLSTYCRTVL